MPLHLRLARCREHSFGLFLSCNHKFNINFKCFQMGGQGTVTSMLNLNFFLLLPFCLIKNLLFSNLQYMAKVEMTNFSSIKKRCASIFLGMKCLFLSFCFCFCLRPKAEGFAPAASASASASKSDLRSIPANNC